MSAANEGYADQSARTKSKMSDAAGGVQEAVRETADQLRAQASTYADAGKRSAEDVAERTAEMGRQASNSIQEVAANFREAVERSVEKQPLTTVLIAVAAGVILGGLMRR